MSTGGGAPSTRFRRYAAQRVRKCSGTGGFIPLVKTTPQTQSAVQLADCALILYQFPGAVKEGYSVYISPHGRTFTQVGRGWLTFLEQFLQ